MPESKHNLRKVNLARLMLTIFAILILSIGFWQQQNIRDEINLYGYTPPASVVQLADDVQLTPSARRMFYVNHPELLDRSAFNSSCSNRGEHTIVLGCYHPVDRGIFVFHVSDDRLTGVDQVTAAHEMLHAAYDRLGSRDRAHIDQLLLDFYNTKLSDPRIKTVIDTYRKTEPNDVPNEMHSVFGTEVTTLTPELEAYYKHYFTDRSLVTKYANDYQAEFTTRQQKVAEYDTQLTNMKNQIDNNTNELEAQESRISAFKRQMDIQRSTGDIAGYNANVPVYNGQVDAYNNLISTTKGLITSYNQVVITRNELALQVTQLAQSIDSSIKPIQ
jgi:hypothetical protein